MMLKNRKANVKGHLRLTHFNFISLQFLWETLPTPDLRKTNMLTCQGQQHPSSYSKQGARKLKAVFRHCAYGLGLELKAPSAPTSSFNVQGTSYVRKRIGSCSQWLLKSLFFIQQLFSVILLFISRAYIFVYTSSGLYLMRSSPFVMFLIIHIILLVTFIW
jgi:hypothetical protein